MAKTKYLNFCLKKDRSCVAKGRLVCFIWWFHVSGNKGKNCKAIQDEIQSTIKPYLEC